MAETNYPYEYSAFTGLVAPYTEPNGGRLKVEVQESAIITALDRVDTDDGTSTCNIWFKDALSAGDETILNGLVAAHTGEPLVPSLPIQPVREIDVYDLDPNRARTKIKGINFDVDTASWAKHGVSFPYEVNMLNGEGYAAFAEDGDIAEFSVAPQVVGGIGAPAAADATQIVVDDGLKGLFLNKTLFPGMWFQYERSPSGAPSGPDSTRPGDDENQIASFDPDTNTITLMTGLQSAVSPGDYIYVVIKYGEDIELQAGEFVDVGGRAAGAAPVPANTVFNIWYYNSGVAQKRVILRLNLKYGPHEE